MLGTTREHVGPALDTSSVILILLAGRVPQPITNSAILLVTGEAHRCVGQDVLLLLASMHIAGTRPPISYRLGTGYDISLSNR